jgi:modulator of drug activity B
MKILIITTKYTIFEAKGHLNGFLAHLSEKFLIGKGHDVKFSDVSKETLNIERELDKLLWAECVIYITPIMWFNMPYPLVKWLGEVLAYQKTFTITDVYGEGGQVPAEKFMIVATSNMKSSDLGQCHVLKNAHHIDDVLQPLIMTNNYLSIRNQLPTFHADNVIAGDTSWIENAYLEHLAANFS